jgi:hypothetical protein
MNYSYHCSYCGYTVIGMKTEVTKARKEHRPYIIALARKATCPLVPLKDGTLMRPQLVNYLRSDKGRHNTLEVV